MASIIVLVLRSDPHLIRIRSTHQGDDEDWNRADVKPSGAGANEYIMKPFTPEILTDELRLLGRVE